MRFLLGIVLLLLLSAFSPAIVQQHPTIRVVQTQSLPSPGASTGTQTCTWNFGKAILPGDTVVGFIHSTNSTDAVASPPMTPDSITDNASNTYNMVTATTWAPWPEDIQVYWLTNVQGRPTTFTYDFTSYPNTGSTIIGSGSCNVGFSEFSGVGSVLISGPIDINNSLAPTISITPQANSPIWVFGTIDNTTPSGIGFAGGLPNAGYYGVIDNWSQDDLGVWWSKFPTGPQTLTFNNPKGQTANACNVYSCDAAFFLAALQASPQMALPKYGSVTESVAGAGNCGTASPGATTCAWTAPTLTSGDVAYVGSYGCPGSVGCNAGTMPAVSSISGTGLSSCAKVTNGSEFDANQHIGLELWKCLVTSSGTPTVTITWASAAAFGAGWIFDLAGTKIGDLGIGNSSTGITADSNDKSGESYTLSSSASNTWTNALNITYMLANSPFLSTKGMVKLLDDTVNTGILVTAAPAAFGTVNSGMQTVTSPVPSGIMTVVR